MQRQRLAGNAPLELAQSARNFDTGYPQGEGRRISFPFLPSPCATPMMSRANSLTDPEENALTVMKFGGSSLAGAEHLRRVASIVRSRLHERPVVVLSAMGKTTNELIAAAERALAAREVDISKIRNLTVGVMEELGVPVPGDIERLLQELERVISGISLLCEVSDRTRDLVVSFGERLSVRVFAALFNHRREEQPADGKEAPMEARALDSWQVGMLTSSGAGSGSSTFSQAEVLPEAYSAIREHLAPLEEHYSFVPIITGYIAKDGEGTITTLGRDGSDLTATIVGAAVVAEEVQIWKDVDGVLTTDPRVVKEARPLSVLTFEEAAELTTFGAKVVHPAAVMPAWLAGVPLSVRNSMAPDVPGTRIVPDLTQEDIKERGSRVAAISSKRRIAMMTMTSLRKMRGHGFLAAIFRVFKRNEICIDTISTSEVTVSLTLDQSFKPIDIEALRAELESVATVEVKEGLSTLTLIAPRKQCNGVLREAFCIFQDMGVEVELVSHGASNVNVTFVLPEPSLESCTQRLHKAFFDGGANRCSSLEVVAAC